MASETQTAPSSHPKFSRYRSIKRASARDTSHLPPLPTTLPQVKPESTSQSFSRYRRTGPENPPPTHPLNLASEFVQGYGKEQPPSPKDHASRHIVSTLQTSQSEGHIVSVATQGAHELPRSLAVDCSKATTRRGPILEPQQHDRHMNTKLLGPPSHPRGEGAQIAPELASRRQGYGDRAGREGLHLPETEPRQKVGRESLRRQSTEEICEKLLGEQDSRGGLGGGTRKSELEINETRQHKLSGQKRDVTQSTAALRKDIRGDKFANRTSSGCDRPSPAMPASNGKQEEGTLSPPVHLEIGGGRVMSGFDTPLSAVNARQRVGYVPFLCFDRL